MPTTGNAGPFHKVMRQFYEEIDSLIEKASTHRAINCKRGCDHCCHMMATMGISDGIYLAEHVMSMGNGKELFERAFEEAKIQQNYLSQDFDDYWRDVHHPCVFLNEHECSVYDHRPIVCRTHVSATDPQLCGIRDKRVDVLSLDVSEVRSRGLMLDHQVFGRLVVAPMPLMLLYAGRLYSETTKNPNSRWMREKSDSLISPDEWMIKSIEGLEVSQEGGRK